MEMKLSNGEYVPDAEFGAGFETVTGLEETIQRIMFKLKVHRGSFPMFPELGSELWKLYREKRSNRSSAAYQYMTQALDGENGVQIDGVRISESGNTLTVNVEMLINKKAALISVEI